MAANVVVQLSGIGELPGDVPPADAVKSARIYGAGNLAFGVACAVGARQLFKTGHPGWGVLVGLWAASGFVVGGTILATGRIAL